MNAKEKLLERAPHWTEEHAERALVAAETDPEANEWGDPATLHEASITATMRRLADEERAAGLTPW